MDTFFYVRTLGYACAPLAEFEQFVTDSGLSLEGPLAALLRLEYQAALAEIRDHQQATFHKTMSNRRLVEVVC